VLSHPVVPVIRVTGSISHGSVSELRLSEHKGAKRQCHGARRELGLMRYACLAFILFGDDRLGHAEEGMGMRDTDSFS
jgi:hypothetical protein